MPGRVVIQQTARAADVNTCEPSKVEQVWEKPVQQPRGPTQGQSLLPESKTARRRQHWAASGK